jgi:hypothetical protein
MPLVKFSTKMLSGVAGTKLTNMPKLRKLRIPKANKAKASTNSSQIMTFAASERVSGGACTWLIADIVAVLADGGETAVWDIVQRRIFVLYLSIALLGAVLLGFVTNWLLG